MGTQIVIILSLLMALPSLAVEKMIYGKDDRYEASEYPYEKFRTLSKSTAAAIKTNLIYSRGFNKSSIVAPSLSKSMNICPGNRFEDQMVAASCTGVLISKNKILTAGHCVADLEACSEIKWVFGYEHKSNVISNKKIFSCKTILAREIDPYSELVYAIIQLDRNVTEIKPVKIPRYNDVEAGDEMVAIGHPSGLPLKISDHGIVREEQLGDVFFQTSLDTFVFSSGSPVYDRITARLQGILVRGDNDYLYDFDNDCTMLNRNTQDGGRGEDVIKISAIPNLESFLD